MIRLCILFGAPAISHGTESEVFDNFIGDVIETWQLRSPTILVEGELPNVCMTHQWLLCLSNNQGTIDLRNHLDYIQQSRRQDGVIFSDDEGMATLIKATSHSLYRSPLPVFMPIKYADLIELRLDSNVLFYRSLGGEEITIVDMFAVKDGKPIIRELGLWKMSNGLKLFYRKNRWDRRTDLNGAEVTETVFLDDNISKLVYNHGTLVASFGLHADRLHAFADTVNLKIRTIRTYDGRFGKQMRNGSWNGNVGMLTRKDADVAFRLAWTLQRDMFIDYVDALKVPLGGYTLIGKKTRLKALDMWVYVGVFGFLQWGLIVTSLLLVFLTLQLCHLVCIEEDVRLSEEVVTGFNIVFLFLIQLGRHPERGPKTRRLLYLVTGVMTYLIYAYYTTDVTAQMTYREVEDNPFRSFDDVSKNTDIKVITVKGSSWESHIRNSYPGTTKHGVYKGRMENNDVWYDTIDAAIDAVLSDPSSNTYFYGHNVLAFSHPELRSVKMLDTSVVSAGMGLQKGSEFLDLFNYQMIKLAEVGIIKRINMNWPDTSRNEDLGIAEPGSLGFNNVLFPFTQLTLGILTACLSACMEFLFNHVLKKSKARG